LFIKKNKNVSRYKLATLFFKLKLTGNYISLFIEKIGSKERTNIYF